MELTLLERIVLPQILPTVGKYEANKLTKGILNKIDITSDDIDLYEIKTLTNKIVWNAAGTLAKFNYELNDTESLHVVDALKKADETATLPMDLQDLYEREVIKK